MVPIRRNRRQVLKGVGRIASIGVVGQWGGFAIGHSNASNTALAAVVPDKRFVDAAYEMQRRSIDTGDQAFGAVVVKDGRIVGDGPSRVITNHDANGTCRDGSNPRCLAPVGNPRSQRLFDVFDVSAVPDV